MSMSRTFIFEVSGISLAAAAPWAATAVAREASRTSDRVIASLLASGFQPIEEAQGFQLPPQLSGLFGRETLVRQAWRADVDSEHPHHRLRRGQVAVSREQPNQLRAAKLLVACRLHVAPF